MLEFGFENLKIAREVWRFKPHHFSDWVKIAASSS